MGERPVLRYTINVKGKERLIATVRERDNGDLMLVMRHAEWHREDLINEETIESPIKQEKYSIHRSLNSQNTNTLKKTHHHQESENDDGEILRYQVTEALKVDDQFAPLFVKKMPDLIEPLYDIKSGDNVPRVSIGSYDPEEYSLHIALLISNRERKFKKPLKGDFFRFRQDKFQFFSLTMCWSFLPVKSWENGVIADIITLPPNHPEYVPSNPSCSEADFTSTFKGVLEELRVLNFQGLHATKRIDDRELVLFNAMPFGPYPNTQSPVYKSLFRQRRRELMDAGMPDPLHLLASEPQ